MIKIVEVKSSNSLSCSSLSVVSLKKSKLMQKKSLRVTQYRGHQIGVLENMWKRYNISYIMVELKCTIDRTFTLTFSLNTYHHI